MLRFHSFPRGRDVWSWPPLAVALIAAAALLAVSAGRIVARERAIARERQILEVRLQALESEIQRLRQALAASVSPEAIERQAKEQLNLKRAGEEVVVIVPERSSGVGAAARGGWRFFPEWLRHLVDFLRP